MSTIAEVEVVQATSSQPIVMLSKAVLLDHCVKLNKARVKC